MGLYDEYIDGGVYVQIKASNDDESMPTRKVGERVPLEDGIYIGYEGAVVIKNGVFVAAFDELNDKWGGVLVTEFDELLNLNNPIANALIASSCPNLPTSKDVIVFDGHTDKKGFLVLNGNWFNFGIGKERANQQVRVTIERVGK